MPLVDTPQKRDGRPSPEQMNSMSGDVPEALLFHLVCAQETEREKLFRQRELLVFVVIPEKLDQAMESGIYPTHGWEGQRTQEIRR